MDPQCQCGAVQPPVAYCFSQKCKCYLCAQCESRHGSGHECFPLSELEQNPALLLQKRIEDAEKSTVALREYRKLLEEKELTITRVANRLREDVARLLREIHGLASSCVESETESQLFQLAQTSGKKAQADARIKQQTELMQMLKKKREIAKKLRSQTAAIQFYTSLERAPDCEMSAGSDVMKEIAKCEYDYKANRLVQFLSAQSDRLREMGGSVSDSHTVAKEESQLSPAPQSPFVYFLKENANEILVYNLELRKSVRILVDGWKAAKHMDSVAVGSRIYCSGGGMYQKATFDYEYVATANTMRGRADMLVGKTLHKLVVCVSDGKCGIYSVCGQGPNGLLNICERYDIRSDSWSLCPSLNEAKYGVSAVAFNSRVIYCFGGLGATADGVEKFLSTIECLDTTKADTWHIVEIAGVDCYGPALDMAAVQVSKTQIVIFGGFSGDFSYKSAVFDVTTGDMGAMPSLVLGESFHGSRPTMFSGKLCAIGYRRKDLHVLDLRPGGTKKRRWELVKAEEWMAEPAVQKASDSMILVRI